MARQVGTGGRLPDDQDQELQFRLVFENGLDAFLIADNQARYVEANPAACKLLGCSRDYIVGRYVQDFIPRAQRPAVEQAWVRFLAAGQQRGLITLSLPDGTSKEVEYAAKANIGPGLHLSILRDITEQNIAREELRETEARLGAILNQVTIGFAQTDLSGRFLQVNQRYCEIVGRPVNELLSMRLKDITHPEDLPGNLQLFEAMIAGGPDFVIEKRYVRPDGSPVWVNKSVTLVRDSGGRPSSAVAIVQDITDRKQAEEALQASEQRLRLALDAGGMGNWEWSVETGSVIWSPGLERIHGRAPGTFPGTFEGVLEEMHPEDREKFSNSLFRSLESGGEFHVEYRILLPDGRIRWLEGWGKVYRDEAGRPQRMIGVCLDITWRKHAEDALRESEQRFALFMQHLPGAAWMKDVDGRYVYANETAERIFQTPLDKLRGKTDEEVFAPETARQFKENDRIALTSGKCLQTVETLPQQDGVHHSVVSKFPILDDQSKPVMVGGIAIDITERRKAEEALRESEESYRVVAETAGDGILKIDADSLILFANRAVEKIFGYAPAELLGRPVTMLMPEYLRHVHKASMRRYTETGARHISWDSLELPGLHKDGREIPLEVSFGEFTKDGKHIFTGMIRDITERKRTERHLETQHAVTRILSEFSTVEEIAPRVLRAICETSNWAVGIFWTVDHTANVLRPVALWHQPSADVPLFEERSRAITFRSGKGLPGRVWATGQAAWIQDVVIDDNFPRAPAALAAGLHGAVGFPISLNAEVLGVMEFFSAEIRELDAQLQQMLTAVGSQIGNFLERRRLEEQLLQGQKLESIGLLAGGIAHDFNNLLTGILGGASVVLDTLPKNHPGEEVLQNVIQASERAADLTRQLLAYAGKGQFIVEPVHLSDLVRHITDLIRSSIPRSVHLLLELDPDIPAVQADAGQLQQVIMNLVINAAEAVGDKGSGAGAVVARTGALSVDETYIREFEMDAAAGANGLSVGRYVYLEVIDTGIGMDEATKARIFDPFFTTKFTGRGLGLAAALGIVRSHKGALSVSSLPGAGSTFRVLFPAVSAEIIVPDEPAEARLKVCGTVLVVDDEDVVRRTVKVALESKGFEVAVAENGREAIELLRQNSDRISLVLLDLTMPVMNGEETLERLREIRADVPVIISSGYSEAEARRRMGNMGALTFIQKPYTGARLVEAISGALRPNP